MADLIVKTNRLNSAVQNLSLLEARIIQLAIIDARESGQGLSVDKPLTITAERYATAFNINKKNAYGMIKQAEDTLFNRRFSFIDADGHIVKSRWLQQVKYLDNQGAIELVFTLAVVQGITRIDGAVEFFTKYLLNNTISFKSVYSVRLYELLSQWKNAEKGKTPVFELEVFRGQLGLDPNEYTRMFDFKKFALDKAVAEINKHSDLMVSYEQHKKGRVIYGFSFKIKIKDSKPKIKQKELPHQTTDLWHGFTETERQTIQQRIEHYIESKEQQGETITVWHRENITKKAIAERWGLDEPGTTKKQFNPLAQMAQEKAQQITEDKRKSQTMAKSRQNHQRLIAQFESLLPEEQKKVLKQVKQACPKSIFALVKKDFMENTAHKNRMLMDYFKQALGG